MPPESALPKKPPSRQFQDIAFYVDEDILGFGHAMMWARTDTVTCGAQVVMPDLPREIPDAKWIPIVARHGWVTITGNIKIRTNPVEGPIAVDTAARIVCVHDVRGNLSTWGKLMQLARWWPSVSKFIDENPHGPWWLSVVPSGARPLDYPPSPE